MLWRSEVSSGFKIECVLCMGVCGGLTRGYEELRGAEVDDTYLTHGFSY